MLLVGVMCMIQLCEALQSVLQACTAAHTTSLPFPPFAAAHTTFLPFLRFAASDTLTADSTYADSALSPYHCVASYRQCRCHKDSSALPTAATAGGGEACNHQVSSVLLHPGAVAGGPGTSGRYVVEPNGVKHYDCRL
jgi:hypothetical protein